MNDDKNIERAEVLRDWPDSPSPRSEPASLQEQIRQWLNDPDHHPDMLEYAGSEAVELLEAAAAALDAKDRDITRLMNQVGADNEQQLAEAKARVKELEGRLLKEPWCEQCGVTIRECPTCYQLFERALEPSK